MYCLAGNPSEDIAFATPLLSAGLSDLDLDILNCASIFPLSDSVGQGAGANLDD